MKPVHLVLFLRALKSPNTDEAVDQKEPKVTVFVVRLPSLASENGHGRGVMRGVNWLCSCRFLVGLGVVGCAYEICQIQNKGMRMFLVSESEQ